MSQALSDLETKAAMRNIILLQCAGSISSVIFSNGILLNYLFRLDLDQSRVIQLLSLPNLISIFIVIPAAWISDQIGKKKISISGQILTILGFLFIANAGLFASISPTITVSFGIILYSIGITGFSSNWFAILSPIIPEEIRGRFFGKLRLSWQTVSIILTFLVSLLISEKTSMMGFRVFLWILTFLLAVRLFLFCKVPELETQKGNKQKLHASVIDVFRTPYFLKFCLYMFSVSFFVGVCPLLFGMLEKKALGFSESQIVFMGMILLLGTLGGFYLGGIVVDRLGGKRVFLVNHFLYAIVLVLLVMRSLFPFSNQVILAILTFCFGLIQASNGIAWTTELFAILPKQNKSLATSFTTAFTAGAMALAGFSVAWILDNDWLDNENTFLSIPLNPYDVLIFICSIGILISGVFLLYLPMSRSKAKIMPKSGVSSTNS